MTVTVLIYCLTATDFSMYGARSDERKGLSFVGGVVGIYKHYSLSVVTVDVVFSFTHTHVYTRPLPSLSLS
jgi:hypothetical protein